MAIQGPQISPDVQSILSDVAIAEAQKRATLGQQMARREQALRAARQLQGKDVLRAMGLRAGLADREAAMMQEIAEQRRRYEAQKTADDFETALAMIGSGMAMQPYLEARSQEKEQEQLASLGGGTTASKPASAMTAEQMQIMKEAQGRAQSAVDPAEQMQIMRDASNLVRLLGA